MANTTATLLLPLIPLIGIQLSSAAREIDLFQQEIDEPRGSDIDLLLIPLSLGRFTAIHAFNTLFVIFGMVVIEELSVGIVRIVSLTVLAAYLILIPYLEVEEYDQFDQNIFHKSTIIHCGGSLIATFAVVTPHITVSTQKIVDAFRELGMVSSEVSANELPIGELTFTFGLLFGIILLVFSFVGTLGVEVKEYKHKRVPKWGM